VTAVLGPVPCHDCRSPLTWDGRRWTIDGREHRCTRPLCMTPDEWVAWKAANDMITGRRRAASPCTDCTVAFSLTQRAINRCNGVPGVTRPLRPQPVSAAVERRRELWREAQRRRRERMAAA
jgi:hypothetical protein